MLAIGVMPNLEFSRYITGMILSHRIVFKCPIDVGSIKGERLGLMKQGFTVENVAVLEKNLQSERKGDGREANR